MDIQFIPLFDADSDDFDDRFGRKHIVEHPKVVDTEFPFRQLIRPKYYMNYYTRVACEASLSVAPTFPL